MKKARYAEEQIIGAIRNMWQVPRWTTCAESWAFPMAPSTTGVASTLALK